MTLLKRLILFTLLLTIAFPYHAFAYKVVLDAGHGGSDPGAIGIGGLRETDVNLDITLKVRQALIDRGYDVVMTRTNDTFWPLAQRVAFTNDQQADLFVSIHANAHPSSSINGTMVLYYDSAYPQEDYPASSTMTQLTPYSKDLAQHVQDALVAAGGTKDLGLTPSAVYVARMGIIPSILVETAFLTNKGDAALLANDAVRSKMALGIANGIAAYQPPLFTDVLVHWSRSAVLRMKNKGIIEGVGNNYEPDRALTRAEFLTLMDRVFNFSKLPAACDTTGTVTSNVYGCAPSAPTSYVDLPASHWASAVFAKASKLQLLTGYGDGTIRPNQAITRGEVAYLFNRLLQMTSPTAQITANDSFDDVPKSLWSASAIYTLKDKGIINGITDSSFKPEQTMSRAEIAALLDRYVSK
ncbi:N-acetylmuramoyl-L-alanine amidase [Paenibacillus pectinilyticus]|uniref:N-acetylmuramoyl-L-alanine amidase n=1 Tax=Paenibacillus pectinilyticus TaxID=512399 RepID=A0A1C1A307_9BACL|nr:N-acetylmuramoyl-L-alanine amidase [Paenibacillus pectinilyticus]OCT14928.1 N-acetylmuramoyl-L-alanine amidase [Paenibacillus pectinilyticus]